MLENPRDLLSMEVMMKDKEEIQGKILMDQDFLQSFKKLDITQVQSEKILS